jgi:hypothetical protein
MKSRRQKLGKSRKQKTYKKRGGWFNYLKKDCPTLNFNKIDDIINSNSNDKKVAKTITMLRNSECFRDKKYDKNIKKTISDYLIKLENKLKILHNEKKEKELEEESIKKKLEKESFDKKIKERIKEYNNDPKNIMEIINIIFSQNIISGNAGHIKNAIDTINKLKTTIVNLNDKELIEHKIYNLEIKINNLNKEKNKAFFYKSKSY